VLAELHDLPPLLIQAGGAETLLDDSRRLHAAAQSGGIDAELRVYPDMIHAFMLMPHMPRYREALDDLASHLREHTGG
jgi:monoterpene epsilon-lactone hydrolase